METGAGLSQTDQDTEGGSGRDKDVRAVTERLTSAVLKPELADPPYSQILDDKQTFNSSCLNDNSKHGKLLPEAYFLLKEPGFSIGITTLSETRGWLSER